MTEVLPAHNDVAAVELAVGHAAIWNEPGWPQFISEQPHTYATRAVVAAPTVNELELSSQLTSWQAMRSTSLAILADAALMAGCDAFEVRYVVTPAAVGPALVRMYLTAKVRGWYQEAAQAAVAAACEKLPKGFTTARPDGELGFGQNPTGEQLVIELRRDEEATAPQWTFIPADFYYTINDNPGDGSGWQVFWRSLVRVTEPVTVSLLFQQTEMHWDERNVLASVLTDLARFSEQRTEYDVMGNPLVYPACMNAKLALASWQKRLERLHRPLLARLAVRGEIATAVRVATALATAVATTGEATGAHPMYYEAPDTPADRRQADFSFDWLEILPWGGHGIWADEQAPHSLRRLPYLFGLSEAASLLVLPVPDEQGVAGLPRARRVVARREELDARSEDPASGVLLGSALHHGAPGSSVSLPLSAINQHVLVVGMPGSGKTTTLLSSLVQLWRKHRIPFLVLESIKAEYRSLIGEDGFEDLQVITLGNELVAPLRLNPLAPPPGVRSELHQASVLAALKLALPLFPPLPQILAKALTMTYDAAGWSDNTTIADGVEPPTLRDLRRQFGVAFEKLGYKGEGRDIRPAFEARLDSLLQGYLGKIFDTVHSTDLDQLLELPVVVEMNEIADPDDRALLGAFLLNRVRAAAKTRGSTGGQLRHVTVIEEAHRLLAGATSDGNLESGDRLKAESVRSFCEAIGELRALGEGFILSSQSPSALASAAVKNTGTRIVHRMESAVDRDAVLDDMDADRQVRGIAARLAKGEAVVRWPERDEATIVQIAPALGVDSGRKVKDELVAEHMTGYTSQLRLLLPYKLCSLEICPQGCEPDIRRAGRVAAMAAEGEPLRLINASRSELDAPVAITQLLADEAKNDRQTTYCAGAQLAAEDQAFLGGASRVFDQVTLLRAVQLAIRRP